MPNEPQDLYGFDQFRLDLARRRLTRNGEIVALTPKAFEILSVLVQSGGRIVEKEDLLHSVWPDTFVEEGNLSVHIFALRKALGETPDERSYIETIPRQGYRFTAVAKEIAPTGADLIVSRYTRSQVTIEEKETSDEKEDSLPVPKDLISTVSAIKRWSFFKKSLAVLPLLAIAIVGFFYFRTVRNQAQPPAVTVHSIAVLPFRSLGSQENEHLGLGMADALITKLGSVRQINVRPTSAVAKYANGNDDPQAIGRALGVDAVLAGRIQREGERVRATVQLINVRDGSLLWATTFDNQETDIFGVQDSISEHVVKTLSLSITPSENKRFTKRYTENTEAYLEYIKGRYFWSKRTAADAEKAIEHFEKAIALDTNYALAYSGLADTYAIRAALPPKVAIPKATVAAMKAVELDSELAEAHTSLAIIKELYAWDRAGAEAEYKRALELNPNYGLAHGFYSMFLTAMGRFEEGAAEAKRGQEIDPFSANMHIYAGWNFFNARQYDRSIDEALRAADLDPNLSMAYNLMVRAYALKQMYNEAIAAGEKARTISNQGTMVSKEYPYSLASLGFAYALSGRLHEAREILEELKNLSNSNYVSPNHFAIIYVGLGEKDQALQYLEKTSEERDEMLRFLKVSPIFDHLHSDPRFIDLLHRVGFP